MTVLIRGSPGDDWLSSTALLDDSICTLRRRIQDNLIETVPTEAMTGTALDAAEGGSARVALR
jgi:hypothetical protein